ncbi:helix-turn-helix domain-containing protein [Leptolyngbya sp. BL0902]|uniref:helix-turn-helix domain-containing protein n=1 Tax=Leptolyngbya sp. BL0902 TaxID=1115757 RepID=UPI0018E88574|nr:RodZ domain-containing protein [Leptolyngbya sp. BL0902]
MVDSNSLYRTQLIELGKLLQTARQDQGYSLETMASKTLIRASLLNAIEQGDLNGLPEPVYIRGLLRRYGDVLGLDGENLASQFFAPPRVQPRSWKDSPAAQLRPLHLYAAYFVVLMAAVSGLSYVLRQTAPETTTLPPLDPLNPVEALSNPVAPAAPEAAPEVAAPNAPIEVTTTLTAQSWMRVTADGSTQFEGILQPGDSRLWKADQALTIRAGNAGAVVVSFNNQQAETLGQPGMVKEVTYSPANMVSLAP